MKSTVLLVAIRLSSLEVDSATQFQILSETFYISHCINTLGKGENPRILPSLPAMVNSWEDWALGLATGLEERVESKPAVELERDWLRLTIYAQNQIRAMKSMNGFNVTSLTSINYTYNSKSRNED